MKKYSNIIDLQLHSKSYKCQLTKDKNIEIRNSKGEYINTYLSLLPEKEKTKASIFANKILSFAEIALGNES